MAIKAPLGCLKCSTLIISFDIIKVLLCISEKYLHNFHMTNACFLDLNLDLMLHHGATKQQTYNESAGYMGEGSRGEWWGVTVL